MEKNQENPVDTLREPKGQVEAQKQDAQQSAQQVDPSMHQNTPIDLEGLVEQFKTEAQSVTSECLPQLLHIFIIERQWSKILKTVICINRLLKKNKVHIQLIDGLGGHLLRTAFFFFLTAMDRPKCLLPHLLRLLKFMICLQSWRQIFLQQHIIRFACQDLPNCQEWLDILEIMLIYDGCAKSEDIDSLINSSRHLVNNSSLLSRLAISVCLAAQLQLTNQIKQFVRQLSMAIPNDEYPMYSLLQLLVLSDTGQQSSLLLQRLLTTNNLNNIEKIQILKIYIRVHEHKIGYILEKIRNVDMLPPIKRCLEDFYVGRDIALKSLRIYLAEDPDKGQQLLLDHILMDMLLGALMSSNDMKFHIDFWSTIMIFLKRIDGRVLLPVMFKTNFIYLMNFLIIEENYHSNDIGLTVIQNVLKKIYKASNTEEWELFKLLLENHNTFSLVSALGYDKDRITGLERHGHMASMTSYILRMKGAESLPIMEARQKRQLLFEIEARKKRIVRRRKKCRRIERAFRLPTEEVKMPPLPQLQVEDEAVQVFNALEKQQGV